MKVPAKGRAHPAKAGHSSFGMCPESQPSTQPATTLIHRADFKTGWGRRICPGADLASNSLFVALAKLIWAYDIRGIDGRVYSTFDYTDGFNVRPKKFECQIRVRSEAHRDVLEHENEQAEKVMAKFPPFRE